MLVPEEEIEVPVVPVFFPVLDEEEEDVILESVEEVLAVVEGDEDPGY